MRWKQNFIIFQIMGADLVILLGLPALFAFFKIAAEATLLKRDDKNKPKRPKVELENYELKLLNVQKYQICSNI